jgi:hypothetical protein
MSAPRAPEASMRLRRLVGASGRPLNFTARGRQMRGYVIPILSALPFVSPVLADSVTSPPPSRDIYDRYIAASVFEKRVALCERLVPETYRAFEPRIVQWRAENRALIERLDVPAHQWRLPDDWKVDDILKGILASVADEAAKRPQGAQSNECARLLQRLVSTSNSRWRGP